MAIATDYRSAEQVLFDWVGIAPTDRSVALHRHGVTARVFDAGDGPAVLFLHGTTNSAASWATLMGRLDGFRCLGFDRPGCGLSEPLSRPPGIAGLPEHGDTLVVDVLDALGIERAHLVSTSYGGYHALRTAAAHPDRVDRIVHLGWTLGAPTGRLPAIMRLAGIPGLARLMSAMPVNARAVRSMFRQIGLGGALEEGRIDQQVIDTYVALLRHTDTMRNEVAMAGGASITALVTAAELGDDLLGSIGAPMLFLWGDADPFGPPPVARAFAARIPTAQLELVSGAGHAVWLDDLEATAARTREFLSS